MSDTPRTDSLLEGEGTQCSVNIVKLLDLCRKFERELNELRDRQWANGIPSCHNACARPMCVLRRERDEARKDVRDLMEQYQDRESQSDSNYLWKKHEDTELIEAICTRLIEWETKANP